MKANRFSHSVLLLITLTISGCATNVDTTETGTGDQPTTASSSSTGVAPLTCTNDLDCDDGFTCQADQIGCGTRSCQSEPEKCTMDLVTYCGCDGLAFKASGSPECVWKNWEHKGHCGTDPDPIWSGCAGGLENGCCEQDSDCAAEGVTCSNGYCFN